MHLAAHPRGVGKPRAGGVGNPGAPGGAEYDHADPFPGQAVQTEDLQRDGAEIMLPEDAQVAFPLIGAEQQGLESAGRFGPAGAGFQHAVTLRRQTSAGGAGDQVQVDDVRQDAPPEKGAQAHVGREVVAGEGKVAGDQRRIAVLDFQPGTVLPHNAEGHIIIAPGNGQAAGAQHPFGNRRIRRLHVAGVEQRIVGGFGQGAVILAGKSQGNRGAELAQAVGNGAMKLRVPVIIVKIVVAGQHGIAVQEQAGIVTPIAGLGALMVAGVENERLLLSGAQADAAPIGASFQIEFVAALGVKLKEIAFRGADLQSQMGAVHPVIPQLRAVGEIAGEHAAAAAGGCGGLVIIILDVDKARQGTAGLEGFGKGAGAIDLPISEFLFPGERNDLVFLRPEGCGDGGGIHPEQVAAAVERVGQGHIDPVVGQPGDLPVADCRKAQPDDAEFDPPLDAHIHRQPEVLPKIAELLAVMHVPFLNRRRVDERLAWFEIDRDHGINLVQHRDAPNEGGLQLALWFQGDVINHPIIAVAPSYQFEVVVLERIRVGGADYPETLDLDVVIIKIGNIAGGGKVVLGGEILGLALRLDHFPGSFFPVPERLGDALGDRDDAAVIFQQLPGVGVGDISVEAGPPFTFFFDHLAHDIDRRIFIGNQDRRQFIEHRGQGDVQHLPGLRRDANTAGGVADVADGERGRQFRQVQNIPAVIIGDGAGEGAVDLDIGGSERRAAFAIANGAADGMLTVENGGKKQEEQNISSVVKLFEERH